MTIDLKPVYLMAGGPGRSRKQDPVLSLVLRESGKSAPSVGYVGTASDDDARFFGFMTAEIKAAGAGKIEHAIITPARADLKKARSILTSSDVIFIGGGDVERGMEVLREKDMADFLVDLYRQGKPFFGVSAGSIMLGKEWVRWPDPDDEDSAELFPCLGIAPVICDTHAEDDDWQELKALLALEKDGAEGYGIPSGATLKVSPDSAVEAFSGAVAHYVRRDGQVETMPEIAPLRQ